MDTLDYEWNLKAVKSHTSSSGWLGAYFVAQRSLKLIEIFLAQLPSTEIIGMNHHVPSNWWFLEDNILSGDFSKVKNQQVYTQCVFGTWMKYT